MDEVAQQIREDLFVEPIKYYNGDVSVMVRMLLPPQPHPLLSRIVCFQTE